MSSPLGSHCGMMQVALGVTCQDGSPDTAALTGPFPAFGLAASAEEGAKSCFPSIRPCPLSLPSVTTPLLGPSDTSTAGDEPFLPCRSPTPSRAGVSRGTWLAPSQNPFFKPKPLLGVGGRRLRVSLELNPGAGSEQEPQGWDGGSRVGCWVQGPASPHSDGASSSSPRSQTT